MFWVFDEVKRGIYKRNVSQEPEKHGKSEDDMDLPLSDTLAIKGNKLQVFSHFPYSLVSFYKKN